VRQPLAEDPVVHTRYADLTIVGGPESAGPDVEVMRADQIRRKIFRRYIQ
jgi:hypothetical protein